MTGPPTTSAAWLVAMTKVPDDTRSAGQQSHDALQEACELLLRA
jgi:hypothetical protein